LTKDDKKVTLILDSQAKQKALFTNLFFPLAIEI
jgi:hypothetical protein